LRKIPHSLRAQSTVFFSPIFGLFTIPAEPGKAFGPGVHDVEPDVTRQREDGHVGQKLSPHVLAIKA
jgi:hypothetical protein